MGCEHDSLARSGEFHTLSGPLVLDVYKRPLFRTVRFRNLTQSTARRAGDDATHNDGLSAGTERLITPKGAPRGPRSARKRNHPLFLHK